MCEKWAFLGLHGGGGGGLSQFVAVDADMCHPVLDTLLSWIALVEPLAVAQHALKLLHRKVFTPSATALVLGAGPIGLSVIHNLRVKASPSYMGLSHLS
jgi:threonine dehydrogenase-like Zn-dependent dehydrogenase